MTHTTPLPPLPDMTTLTTARHAVLNQIAADLAGRPATTRVAYYDDSPYVPPTGPEAQR